ncbi:ABC transporter substrate-binding protein [Phytohalomonas tamaricis]|uniref:ABC transporter substrate-binding protein n=1 Tax=Phytohalomonas tamaricis TaxID=2081032 RepID=UPI000D0ADE31|nr:extracellular solute-binding protein [Phytohalomonas tamaricis]
MANLVSLSSRPSASHITLRVLGTSVTLLEILRERAEQDLGIRLVYRVCNAQEAQRIAVMEPHSYDLYDQWFHNIDFVWPARAIQPIDICRIRDWDEINMLAKSGSLAENGEMKSSSVPTHRLYVQHDGRLGARPTEAITMLPLTHNVDSFVYRADGLPPGVSAEEESWGWLLDDRFAGKVALQRDATIGAIDAALAAAAQGERFGDIGNLTLDEIDRLTGILAAKHRRGHFADFWANEAEAMRLMENESISVQSLWSPALMRLHKPDSAYCLARPKEGYRAWFGGLCLSRCLQGKALDAAYEYLNWWLSGWPGAIMARQGYYISLPQRARRYLSDDEWQYWYEGKPARTVLLGADGYPLIQTGERRDGGCYRSRMAHIAVWNSVMDEHNYLVRHWTQLLNEGSSHQQSA